MTGSEVTGYDRARSTMGIRAWIILWAQWRTLRNHLPHSNRAGLVFTAALMLVWYGGFTFLGFSAAVFVANPDQLEWIVSTLPRGLLICFLYWQVVPLMTATMGSALDIRKLVVYPIPHRELFLLEILLRLSVRIEVLIVLVATGAGLLLNPRIPAWAPLGLIPFIVLNLFTSLATREFLKSVLARKYIREAAAFVLVMVAALPQILITTGRGRSMVRLLTAGGFLCWPWVGAAQWLAGRPTPAGVFSLLASTVGAYWLGRRQFERSLRFDTGQPGSVPGTERRARGWLEALYRLPGSILTDPLAVLIEKDLRLLTRSARFRLVFVMGFSFGLLIWAPMAFGIASSAGSFMSRNYLTIAGVYGLLLLSDALFWNALGFDRGAVQIYFLAPVKFSRVLIAKNLVAMTFVLLEITAIVTVCGLLRFPLGPAAVLEAYLVPGTVSLFLLSIGNLTSTYNPRPVDPAKSFRSSSPGRTQALLTLLFPVALAPVALAYLARYGFNESNTAFYLTLLFAAAMGAVVYVIALDSAIATTERRREALIAALSRGERPVEG